MKPLNYLCALCLTLSLVPALAAEKVGKTEGAPVQPVPAIEVARYAGTWYEIARLPNRFQKDCVRDVKATYTVQAGGSLQVENTCMTASDKLQRAVGVARKASAEGPNSKLKVRFAPQWLSWVPLVWGDYWVLELDPDYRHVVVGTPDMQYLWILSRRPVLDQQVYEMLIEKARAQGFDVDRLYRTQHKSTVAD